MSLSSAVPVGNASTRWLLEEFREPCGCDFRCIGCNGEVHGEVTAIYGSGGHHGRGFWLKQGNDNTHGKVKQVPEDFEMS
jgi:hypothetical protein